MARSSALRAIFSSKKYGAASPNSGRLSSVRCLGSLLCFCPGDFSALPAPSEEGGAVTDAVLEINDVQKNFGGLVVTDGVTLEIEPGELHAVIGPNGAGKTTLINQISGLIAPAAGTIRFNGADIT